MTAHPESPWLTRDELAELDRIASEEYGLPIAVLMENAGRGAAESMLEMLADPRWKSGAPRVVLLSGPGNNGGDACVVARHLVNARVAANAKVAVEVVATRALDALRGDAALMRRAVERMEIPVHVVADKTGIAADEGLRAIERATLVVDGLLGTGFRGAMRPEIADLVRAANAQRATGMSRTVALDLPSGLDADTGSAADPTIEADLTVTFAARKKGFEAGAAQRFLGRVVVASIGAPDAILERLLRSRRQA
jgi:NAD(P)H-hydrate epimerase